MPHKAVVSKMYPRKVSDVLFNVESHQSVSDLLARPWLHPGFFVTIPGTEFLNKTLNFFSAEAGNLSLAKKEVAPTRQAACGDCDDVR